MAAVEVTITGVLYDKLSRTARPVVLIGDGMLTGLGVGGGPIIPPDQPPGGGGSPPHPAFPIWGPPGSNFPDKPGYPPTAEHPIVRPPEGPPDGGQPPVDTVPGGDKPPPPDHGGWGYVAEWSDGTPGGWGFFPGPGAAGPKG